MYGGTEGRYVCERDGGYLNSDRRTGRRRPGDLGSLGPHPVPGSES